jgi:hypothetical protein
VAMCSVDRFSHEEVLTASAKAVIENRTFSGNYQHYLVVCFVVGCNHIN